jgi:hypothetical protein
MAEWPVNAPGGLPRNYAASTGCNNTLAFLLGNFIFSRPQRNCNTLIGKITFSDVPLIDLVTGYGSIFTVALPTKAIPTTVADPEE